MPDTNRAHDPAHSPWAVPTLMLLIATIALLGAFEALHEHWRTPRERARDSIAEIQRALDRYALEHEGRYPATLGELVAPRTRTVTTTPRAKAEDTSTSSAR